MLVGSILGGVSGERWHGKLVARALDPTIGPEHEVAPTEVRSEGRHFTTDGDTTKREVDVRDTSTTLDDDLMPERTRTLH
jgi:hypothetical protein